jgi:hypothetical protein
LLVTVLNAEIGFVTAAIRMAPSIPTCRQALATLGELRPSILQTLSVAFEGFNARCI